MAFLYTIAPCKLDNKNMELFFIYTTDDRILLNKYTGLEHHYQFKTPRPIRVMYDQISRNQTPLYKNIANYYSYGKHVCDFPKWKEVANSCDYMFVDPRVKKIIDNLKS